VGGGGWLGWKGSADRQLTALPAPETHPGRMAPPRRPAPEPMDTKNNFIYVSS